MGGMDVEGGIARKLWNKFRSESVFVNYTPFFVCLAAGNLNADAFLHYLSQDVHLLNAFANAYELAEECADDEEDKKAIRKLRKHVKDKLKSHDSRVRAYAFRIEELLDTLSISLTGEELDVIEKLYHQSMRLEVDFFSSQLIIQEAVVPLSRMLDPAAGGQLTIFCDFDLTCTALDSSAILAELAIITMQKAEPDGPETQLAQMSLADLRSTWDALSAQYTEEFEQCVESITPTETVKSFSYEGLCEALQQFADFEKKANSRVVQSGVLKGLNQEDIKRAGQSLILQDGCKWFFQKIMKVENPTAAVHILSYCWCGDLIRSAFSSGDLKALNVHSNELACEESITTGEITKKLESPMEKLQAFNNILNSRGNDCQHLTVYIGGSVGDLLCLLEADIGIVMGSSPTLRRLGEQFGVSFMPLFSGLVVKQREVVEVGSSTWKKLSGTLYTVSSWDEIHAFILGS